MGAVEKVVNEVPKTGSNLQSVAEAIGVKPGKPMNFEEADEKHPNPHYKEDVQYRVNCQSAVVAYEMRRRGLPVEAFGKVKDSMGEYLSYNTTAAWVDADGKMPTRIVSKQTIKSRTVDKRGAVRHTYTSADDVLNDFLSQTSETGRYHVSWAWAGKNKGHIITMETFEDGSRLFYDPQTGRMAKNITPWAGERMSKFDLKTRGLCAYRVDNLQPNQIVVKGVVKKAGSMADTPKASFDQISWWLENAQGATSFMGDIEPYSDEIIKQLKKCKTKAQRSSLLEGIARDKGATVLNDNGKAFTTCFPGHRAMKGETWKNTKQMALDLNDKGISVCFLPEHKDKISADAIVKIGDTWKLADFKCSKSQKVNTIAPDVIHAFEQAECCVLKVLKADKGVICDVIDYLVRSNIQIRDFVFINKLGKNKIITKSDVERGKYMNMLKGFF